MRRAVLHDAIVQLEVVQRDPEAVDLLRADWLSIPFLQRPPSDLLGRNLALPEQRLIHLGVKKMHVEHEIDERAAGLPVPRK